MAVVLIKRYFIDLETVCAEIDQAHLTGATRPVALVARYDDALEGGQSLCLSFCYQNRRPFHGYHRDLALFNVAINGKSRGCNLVRMKVVDVMAAEQIKERTSVLQSKRPYT